MCVCCYGDVLDLYGVRYERQTSMGKSLIFERQIKTLIFICHFRLLISLRIVLLHLFSLPFAKVS